VRVLSESEFSREAGLPDLQDQRTQHYGQRDVLAI
jgi:hypothetical protein